MDSRIDETKVWLNHTDSCQRVQKRMEIKLQAQQKKQPFSVPVGPSFTAFSSSTFVLPMTRLGARHRVDERARNTPPHPAIAPRAEAARGTNEGIQSKKENGLLFLACLCAPRRSKAGHERLSVH